MVLHILRSNISFFIAHQFKKHSPPDCVSVYIFMSRKEIVMDFPSQILNEFDIFVSRFFRYFSLGRFYIIFVVFHAAYDSGMPAEFFPIKAQITVAFSIPKKSIRRFSFNRFFIVADCVLAFLRVKIGRDNLFNRQFIFFREFKIPFVVRRHGHNRAGTITG